MDLQQWLDHQQRLHPQAMELGLERVREVAGRMGLGRPARQVISVAGTNGKGSTVAFIEATARAAGWRVGAYTSPHLLRYNERVRIDGREASDAELIAAFEQVEAARGDVALTWFEFGTLAALAQFAGARLDLAVLEVGLGGRLDAVNLVDADVAVITGVALDHAEHLGRDRDAIGVEKAGIARSGRPAVVAETDPPDGLLRALQRVDARVMRAGKSFRQEPGSDGGWRYADEDLRADLPAPKLAGDWQRGNAAAAIAALRALPEGQGIAASALAEGVGAAFAPARLQRFAGPVELVVDVAHNPQAAQQLAHWLIRNRARGSTQAVFAALEDKDIPNLIAPMLTAVDVWRLAGLGDRSPRGGSVESLWRPVSGLLSRSLVSRHDRVEAALDQAFERAAPGDRIVVFGSFLTAAAALARQGRPG